MGIILSLWLDEKIWPHSKTMEKSCWCAGFHERTIQLKNVWISDQVKRTTLIIFSPIQSVRWTRQDVIPVLCYSCRTLKRKTRHPFISITSFYCNVKRSYSRLAPSLPSYIRQLSASHFTQPGAGILGLCIPEDNFSNELGWLIACAGES
jgi:hypothetical protein